MKRSWKRTAKGIGIGALVLVITAAAVHQAIPHGHGASVAVPARSEFGFGPRGSADGRYMATLDPQGTIKVGKMLTMRLAIRDSVGQAVLGAAVTVSGGMPQHEHGLPTQPRVSTTPDGGMYQVDGVKFNMGGWWVFTFHVDAGAGRDSVTFNLDL